MNKNIGIIGYACDFGGTVSGTRAGPKRFREKGLEHRLQSLGFNVTDFGDAELALPASIVHPSNAVKFSEQEAQCKFPFEVFTVCKDLYKLTNDALSAGNFPLVLGGDHSLSIGSVAAIADYYHPQPIGLIWIDAHPDINTPLTSPSKNFFGMSVAVLTGEFAGGLSSLQQHSPAIPHKNLSFIGLRDVDQGEKELIRNKQLSAFSMSEIDKYGIYHCIQESIKIASADTAGFVVSFDLDVCDPHLVPGTGTPMRGGITFREAHLVLETLAASQKMLGFDLVELNPTLDQNDITVDLALGLLESVFGKRILES
jgi:arginase